MASILLFLILKLSTTSLHLYGISLHFPPLDYNITPNSPQNQGFKLNSHKKATKKTLSLFVDFAPFLYNDMKFTL